MLPVAVYSERRAAQIAGCEVDSLRKLAGAGDVVGLKTGRGWVFPATAFIESLNELARRQAETRRVSKVTVAAQGLKAVGVAQRKPAPPDLAALVLGPVGR